MRQITDWEKIFVKDTFEKGLVSKNVQKNLLKLNNGETNNQIFKKMGQRP